MSRHYRLLEFILGLLLGFLIALAVAWWIAPHPRLHSSPSSLHPFYKDEYRLLVANAYNATGDLGRAGIRLSLLEESDMAQSLIDQAIRFRSGQSVSTFFPQAVTQAIHDLAILARDLQNLPQPLDTVIPTAISTASPFPTIAYQPFNLVSSETLCNQDPDSVAQIFVGNSSGQPLPGIQVIVSWEAGLQNIFTGLKPELGLGYADFIMTPGLSYTIQIQTAYQAFTGISSPECESADGSMYPGGLVLIFQQP